MRGYQELRESAAWIDLSSRGRIRLTGEDRVRLLHALTTNHIQQLQPGDGCYVFFLNAQGRILADANVLCVADSLLLDVEPETRARVLEHLDQFIIADDVTPEDVTDSLASIGVEGPTSRQAFGSLTLPEGDGSSVAADGGLTVARITTTGGEGWRVYGSRASVDAFAKASGLIEADAEAVRTVRLEQGRPRYGEEISERFLVQETGQMRAMHFSKGCYLGQEIVERVRSRGQVHRHLMHLAIDGAEPAPQPGDKLTAEGKDMAEVVSAAYSPALERVECMAYVRTDAARAGTVLDWNGRAARVLAPR